MAKSPRKQHDEARRPAVRLCIAADIEHYSRFTDVEAIRAQRRFNDVLRHARAHARLVERQVGVQESGDGQFAVLPPGIDESAVIPDLVTGLTMALRSANADLSRHARLRLRVAVHRGLLTPGANGWIGNSAIAVHRLLDSDQLRTALTREPDADFVLAVGDTVFQDVLAHGYDGLMPHEFQETTVTIPAKRFTERAWIHIVASKTLAAKGNHGSAPRPSNDR